MIYIKRLNFCFIRIPKNASSSVMDFLFRNVCTDEDMVSRAYEWSDDQPTKIYFINCPQLPTSHVDATYVIQNGIVPPSAIFTGIVRDPFERQLSLYLYRIRDRRYDTVLPSPEHFKSLFKNGILQDKPQQMQLQSTFLLPESNYWLYERVDTHLAEFCEQYDIEVKHPLTRLNKSPGNTSALINAFYDDELRAEVSEAHKKDIELYEHLKDLYGIRSERKGSVRRRKTQRGKQKQKS